MAIRDIQISNALSKLRRLNNKKVLGQSDISAIVSAFSTVCQRLDDTITEVERLKKDSPSS
jgi:hypothetical protein